MIGLIDSLEALLFVAGTPVSASELARSLGVTEGQVAMALEVLAKRLDEAGAVRLQEVAGGYQLCTKPEFARSVEQFLKPQPRRLSRALLEVLSVVAYNQPISIGEVEAIRGVQSDYSVRALEERGLVREVGRRSTPGRPAVFSTTEEFLLAFGLKSLDDLPPLPGTQPQELQHALPHAS